MTWFTHPRYAPSIVVIIVLYCSYSSSLHNEVQREAWLSGPCLSVFIVYADQVQSSGVLAKGQRLTHTLKPNMPYLRLIFGAQCLSHVIVIMEEDKV